MTDLNLLIKKQKIFSQSIADGKLAEELAKKELEQEGYTIIPNSGIGSDFGAIDLYGNLLLVEVKSGKSSLSKKQRSTKRIVQKKGIQYLEYRISKQRLEYYKEQKLKEKLQNHHLTSSPFVANQFPGVWLIDIPHTCPNCGLVAEDIIQIFLKFGLRNMGDGTVRQQSWCYECRKFTRRGK
ncbi:MAG: hypothetical protein IIA82_08325 [Thaumarchaeota archaeon]|nr:hypothetical protein [Nitrososphaerota archaeon]